MHSTNTIQTTNEKKSNHRARWAAFGAAVAVSLGAGSIGLVSATAPEGAAAYQAINPCRLADTRPDSNVGPYAAPLGADQIYTFDGWGDVPGVCDLPTGTTALQLNVTAVNATQLTNLRFFPTGSEVPTASNLNPAPNQPPTPNAVTVTLNSEGKFDVFNRFGSVDLVIDVAGVYTDHQHDGDDIIDESLTGTDVADGSLTGADVADESLTGADVADSSLTGDDVKNSSLTRVDIADEPGTVYAAAADPNPLSAVDLVAEVDLKAPSTGHVIVTGSAVIEFSANGQVDEVTCVIYDQTTNIASSLMYYVTEPADGRRQSFEFTRTFPVTAPGENKYQLVCGAPAGTAIASEAFITATYIPTWYGDTGLSPFPMPDLEIQG